MQIEKAKALNEFLNFAKATLQEFWYNRSAEISIPNELKEQLSQKVFDAHYQAFLVELIDNIKTYQDIDIVCDYTVSFFGKIVNWDGYHSETNQSIIAKGFEVTFLLFIKMVIEDLKKKLAMLCTTKSYHQDEFCLQTLFDNVLEKYRILEFPFKDELAQVEPQPAEPIKETRFDFDNLKAEMSLLKKNDEKMELIYNRLLDFDQWQLQVDKIVSPKNDFEYYKYTQKYYPNFIDLCKIEMKRLKRVLEIEEQKKPVNTMQITPKTELYTYKWKASDTDLLEMVTALYKTGAFERRDGKTITRKELTDYFQELLGLEIKDVEGKLTRATGRNDNTPFLDGLKGAFKDYKVEKEVKQRQLKK